MFINEIVRGGIDPLQHAAGPDAERPYHWFRWACRMEPGEGIDERGTPEIERGSVGPIKGGHLWGEDPRTGPGGPAGLTSTTTGGAGPPGQLPMWSFATPVVCSEPPKDPLVPLDLEGSAFAVSTPNGTITRSQADTVAGSPPASSETAGVRPVRSGSWDPDLRYREEHVALPPGMDSIGPGTVGIVLDSTDDNGQSLLFFPSAQPLIAVNFSGDPMRSTLVCDLAGPEIDPNRRAPLHSMMRVIRFAGSCAGLSPGVGRGGSMLAWQLGEGGQDGASGHGLVYGPVQYDTEEGGEVLTPAAEQLHEEERVSTAPLANTDEEHQVWQSNLMAPLGPPPVGVPPADELYESGATRERPKDGDGDTHQSTTKKKTDADDPISACGATVDQMGGPFALADDGDKHRIGQTLDGEAINSVHLDTRSLFRESNDFDAPIHFSAKPWIDPGPAPLSSRVHLEYNEGASHIHPCGTFRGKWMLRAEEPVSFIPEDPDPPPIPRWPEIYGPQGGPSSTAGPVIDAGPGGVPLWGPGPASPQDHEAALWGEGSLGIWREHFRGPDGTYYASDWRTAQREAQDAGVQVTWRPDHYTKWAAGVRESATASAAWAPQYVQRIGDPVPPGGRGYLTAPNCIQVPGLIGRATPTAHGERETSASREPMTPAEVADLAATPQVGALVPFGAGDGTLGGWAYSTRPEFGAPTAAGGFAMVPPGVCAREFLADDQLEGLPSTSLVLQQARADGGGGAALAWGAVDQSTGATSDGYTAKMETDGTWRLSKVVAGAVSSSVTFEQLSASSCDSVAAAARGLVTLASGADGSQVDLLIGSDGYVLWEC